MTSVSYCCSRVCFHGPVAEATAFFSSMGFDCPVRKDPASFLQEVTTPKGEVAVPKLAIPRLSSSTTSLEYPI